MSMQERGSMPSEAFGRSGRHKVEPVAKAAAFGEWNARRKQFSETGRWPLLLATGIFFRDQAPVDTAEAGTVASVIEAAEKVDVPTFLQGLRKEFMDDVLSELKGADRAAFEQAWAVPKPSQLKVERQPDRPLQLIGEPEPVVIVEVPCSARWAVLAEFPWGGWNSVPEDPEIVAVARSWERRFGAVPVTMSHDVLEFWLDQPIVNPEVACEIAVEQASFCIDIVDQGTETVANLAQAILGSRSWFFWWD